MSDQAVVSARLIGEIFVERGIVTREQLDEALALQAESGSLLGEILVSSFGVSRLELATVLAEQWRAVDASGADEPVAPENASQPVVTHPSPAPVSSETRRPLGEIFVASGAVSEAELERALARQRETGEKLGEILVAQGVIGRLELAGALAEQWSELQVIRPPMPKAPEPWQETAVRAATDVEAEAPASAPSDTSAPPTTAVELAGLVDAVAELDLRVTELSRRQLPDIDAVRAEASALADRLEGMDARVERAVDRSTLERLAVSVDELRAEVDQARASIAADADLRSAIDGLAARLEHLEHLGHGEPDPQVGELAAALGALGSRIDELAGSDALGSEVRELEGRLGELAAVLEQRVTSFDDRVRALEERGAEPPDLQHLRDAVHALTIAVDAARDGLVTHAELEAAVAQLGERLETGIVGGDVDAISRLETDLAHIAERVEALRTESEQADGARLDAVWAALDALRGRLDAPAIADETLGTTLDELRARLDEVSAAVDRAPSADRLVALESVLADDALGRLATELDVLARGAARREDVDALRVALARDIEAIRRALAERAHGADEGRVAGLEAALAELAHRVDTEIAHHGAPVDQETARASDGAVRELDERLAVLQVRLDEALAGRRDVEHVEAEVRGELQRLRGALDELASRDHETRAEIEGHLRELASRAELGALAGDVRQRLDQVEAALATAHAHGDEDAEQRLADLRASVTALAQRLDEVARSVESAVGRAELDDRLEALGHAVGDVDARMTHGLGALDARLDSRLTDVASRAELSGLAGELGTRVGTVEGMTAQLGARLDGELGSLHGRLTELVSRVELGEAWERIVGVEGRVEEAVGGIDAALADTVRRDELDQRLDERASRSSAELSAVLDARVAEVASRLDGVEQALADADARSAALDALQHDFASRLGQTVRREELAAFDAALAERVDAQLGEISGAANARVDALALELRETMAVLHGRLDELAAGLGHTGGRLVAVEQALPEAGLVDALAARIEQTHHRVEEEIAAGEQRSQATERAIRKGLAGLGERLVASEQAYLDAGNALRRSIERLGAAVVEADARIAGEPLDPPAAGFVAFVPTADGYRLTALDGLVPELGSIVELDAVEGPHRAARITRSPLPLDRRPCVYLERVV